MTKLKAYTLIIFLSVFNIYTNAQANKMLDWATKGTVTNKNYNSEIPFRYVDGYIFVAINQNNKTYNFLFDTGAEAVVIDQAIINEFKFTPFSTSTISGPVITNASVNTIILSSFSVSNVEFKNIGAVAIDFGFAKKKFCEKVDGIIGSTLLKKAKWQIDYEKKVIRLSDNISNLIAKKPAYKLNTILPAKGWGTESIELNINGYTSKFNFDTGNGRSKIVAHPRNLKSFTKNNIGTILEYGFRKSALDYKFNAESLTIGNLKLNNQTISLQNEVGNDQLLGNRFFQNFVVTIDWDKHTVYLNSTKEIISDNLYNFELDFKPNFESNKIEIATGLKMFTKKHKIRKEATLLNIEGIDVSNFTKQDLCNFWSAEWPKLTAAKELNIVILEKGKSKELILTKNKLI